MKEIIQRYKGTLFLALFLLLIAGYPLVVTVINPIPAREDLQTISAKIIEVKKDAPRMQVQYPNGDIQTLYFPHLMYWIVKGDRPFIHLNDIDRSELLGCNSQIQIIKIKGFISERFRVWNISCPSRTIDFEEFSHWYSVEAAFSKWLELFFLLIIGIVLFRQFKKDQRRA